MADALAWGWIALVVALPLAHLFARAEASVGPDPAAALLGTGLRGLSLAGGVAVVAATLAYPLARAVPTLPLLALALVGAQARSFGVLALGIPTGSPAVMLAMIAGALPVAALLVKIRLQSRPGVWLDAAADLGAGAWRRARTIELPHVAPALALGALWSVLGVLGDAVTPDIAGGGKVYTPGLLLRDALVREDAPMRAAMSCAGFVALALPSAVGVAALLERMTRAVGEAGRAPGRALGFAALVGVLPCVAPLVGLLARASAGRPGHGDAVLAALLPQTAVVALATAAIAMALGFGLALWIGSARRWTARLVLVPLALPPCATGVLALELASIVGWRPGLALTIAGLAPVAVAIGFVTGVLGRARVPAILVDAAADLGAAGWSRVRTVWLPLVRPAWIAAGVLAAAWAASDAAIASFTSGPGGSTVAVGMVVLARTGDIAVVPRWALAQAVLLPAAVWLASRPIVGAWGRP